MTETSVSTTANQVNQARQTLNQTMNQFDSNQYNSNFMNQALMYQNLNQNQQLQYFNQINPYNHPNHIQYINSHMSNPQSQFLYQAATHGFQPNLPLVNNKNSDDFATTPKRPNGIQTFNLDKSLTSVHSTPTDHRDRVEMFKKRSDLDTPNKRFTEVNEVRNSHRKTLKDSNRFANLNCNNLNIIREEHRQAKSSAIILQNNDEEAGFKLVESKNKKINERRQIKAYGSIHTSIFTGKSLHKFNDYKDIYKEIRRFKPNIHIKTAYLNKHKDLVIQTDSKTDQIQIETPWDAAAFETGIQMKERRLKYFASIKGVSKKVNLDDLEDLKSEYKIVELLRLSNKEREMTTTIRVQFESEADLEYCIKGGIYIQDYHYRVIEWENRIKMCYKCQGFGHKAETCEKIQVCVKCTENHSSKECTKSKSEYLCKNCGDNHASWESKCPKMIQKKVEANVRWSQIVAGKSARNTERINDFQAQKNLPQMNETTNELLRKLINRIEILESKLNNQHEAMDQTHDNTIVQNIPQLSNFESRLVALEKKNESITIENKKLTMKVKEQDELITKLKDIIAKQSNPDQTTISNPQADNISLFNQTSNGFAYNEPIIQPFQNTNNSNI